MNYHALAPKRCKRSIVSGFVYRIYHACSNWKNFHDSLERAKRVLEWNQYPPTFWMKPVSSNLSRANHKTGIERFTKQPPTSPSQKTTEVEKVQLRIQYHGKCSEEYVKALHKIEAPCMVVMTLRKLKTVLPFLKSTVEKLLRSGVVYQLMCPSCSAWRADIYKPASRSTSRDLDQWRSTWSNVDQPSQRNMWRSCKHYCGERSIYWHSRL